ncbi:hypothetical protein VTJ83DRAFT_6268 [Remersonia thermophila]|uniref:Leucine rich repeat domain containing protein n=1 Tax=Remersonia thermophila TaxID=72144 RepID=A0ABR4D4B9_9PEZI
MAHPDALPPTYHEATTRPDWLTLVAPYVPLRDYARLCRVSQRFYREFAPRLWGDPIAVLYPDWANQFLAHAKTVRPSTRALVHTYDPRRLFAGVADFALCADSATPLSTVILSKADLFPALRCLLLDGQPGLGPELRWTQSRLHSWASPFLWFMKSLLLLSLAGCRSALPAEIFDATYLKDVVYLDMSDMPGSVSSLMLYRSLRPGRLRNLRVLKVRGCGAGSSAAQQLLFSFRGQLWSIDVSRNRLTDGALDLMSQVCLPQRTLRLVRFASEGRALMDPDASSPWFGRWFTVHESDWSRTFSHPLRYLADPPLYAVPAPQDAGLPNVGHRLDGLVEILPDSADALKLMLAGPAGSHPPDPRHTRISEVLQDQRDITHLYLNDNPDISAAGLARMIRLSGSRLQRLECNSPAIRHPAVASFSWLPSSAKLWGFLGWAHLFRPIFSADLQVLRIHHSLVTQVPSLEIDGLSAAACCWLAETHFLPRAELAYPEVFVPDMNPRLRSLTLCRIPRRSSGPLIDKLISFLRLAAVQERAIQDFKASAGRACEGAVLPGLRHIRLEFEPDVFEAEGILGADDAEDQEYDLDAGTLLDDAAAQFSFFGESRWSPWPASAAAAAPPSAASAHADPGIPPADNRRTRAPPPLASPHKPLSSGRVDGSRHPDSELVRPASTSVLSPASPFTSSSSSQPQPASAFTDIAIIEAIDNPMVNQTFSRREDSTLSDSDSDHASIGYESQNSPTASSVSSYDHDSRPGPGEHYPHTLIRHTWTWEDKTHEKLVLIGEPGHSEPQVTDERERYPPAVHNYARLAHMPCLQRDPCPATPNHIAAGVPEGNVIFSAAWDAMLYPPLPAETQHQAPKTATTTTAAAAAAAAAFDRANAAAGDGTAENDSTSATAEGATRQGTSTDDTSANGNKTPKPTQSRFQKLLTRIKNTNRTTPTATTTTTAKATGKTPSHPPSHASPSPSLPPPPPPPPAPPPRPRRATGPIPIPKPTPADLRRMRDVVAALKAYRRTTKQAQADAGASDPGDEARRRHPHWGGSLEVVV